MMSAYKFYTKKNENWGIFNNFVLHITKPSCQDLTLTRYGLFEYKENEIRFKSEISRYTRPHRRSDHSHCLGLLFFMYQSAYGEGRSDSCRDVCLSVYDSLYPSALLHLAEVYVQFMEG